ncbi:MAG: GAF domain-containing protein [Elusimicrobiota bacterium]|nr:GAF domain-containing protein [Elusimicrobiota bacterium]
MKRTNQERLQELFDIARNLSTLDLDTLLKRIGDAAEQLTNSEASSIMLLDDDKKHLYFKVTTGEKSAILKKLKVKVGEGIAGTVAETLQALVVNDVTKDKRFTGSIDKTSGFVSKSILAVPILLGEELIGVAEVLNKKNNESFTDEDKEILQSLASLAAVSITNAKFAEDQKNFFIYIIEIIVQAIEGRDPRLTGHTWRVAQLSTAIARTLGVNPKEYKDIYYAALLHDIGYLSSRITTEEGYFIEQKPTADKLHSTIGWEMIRKINIISGSAPYILSHHEYYDGSGFPQGLSGENIPLGARIIALSEFIEDMQLKGYQTEKIAALLKSEYSAKFDPKVLEVYLREIVPVSL